MAPKRPSSPKVLGILSIVFGSITALFTLVGLMLSGSVGKMYEDMPGMGDLSGPFQRFEEATRTVSYINAILFTVMSLALIFLGVQQLKYRRAAIKPTIIWGIAALVVLAVIIVLQVTIVGPAPERMMQEFADAMSSEFGGRNPFGGMGSFMTLGAVGSFFFYSPYPIVLLILFTRPKVQAAMVN
jgi:hypothetical protein